MVKLALIFVSCWVPGMLTQFAFGCKCSFSQELECVLCKVTFMRPVRYLLVFIYFLRHLTEDKLNVSKF
jgi:hypothetical protein